MSDELDVYLSRNLKNWASRHQPPVTGRRQLLKRTFVTAPEIERHWYSHLVEDWRNRFAPPVDSPRLHTEWFSEPVSQMATWYLHVSLSNRLAS